jgi:hypothetical protein
MDFLLFDFFFFFFIIILLFCHFLERKGNIVTPPVGLTDYINQIKILESHCKLSVRLRCKYSFHLKTTNLPFIDKVMKFLLLEKVKVQ